MKKSVTAMLHWKPAMSYHKDNSIRADVSRTMQWKLTMMTIYPVGKFPGGALDI